jgi:hypothetical protein
MKIRLIARVTFRRHPAERATLKPLCAIFTRHFRYQFAISGMSRSVAFLRVYLNWEAAAHDSIKMPSVVSRRTAPIAIVDRRERRRPPGPTRETGHNICQEVGLAHLEFCEG